SSKYFNFSSASCNSKHPFLNSFKYSPLFLYVENVPSLNISITHSYNLTLCANILVLYPNPLLSSLYFILFDCPLAYPPKLFRKFLAKNKSLFLLSSFPNSVIKIYCSSSKNNISNTFGVPFIQCMTKLLILNTLTSTSSFVFFPSLLVVLLYSLKVSNPI